MYSLNNTYSLRTCKICYLRCKLVLIVYDRNIEDILALKGDQVRRIGEDGIIEASAEDVRLAMANISKHHDENE